MQTWTPRFNLYFALAVAMALGCGCQTDKSTKFTGALRVYMETPSMMEDSQTVSVLRADPVLVSVSPEPILSERDIASARVIAAAGGFALRIRFHQMAAQLLEQYTAANSGRHLVILGEWTALTPPSQETNSFNGNKFFENQPDNGVTRRWLAAPLITHSISNGILTFTPDMSRAEADQLVAGLANVIAKNS
ncbi:MAG: hypothetical protein KGR98_13145 [Verrucomicrobia bacterium]|nr:hypothetical protein [Verrucomicrobiota bacterium]MDE3099619.1 hypothetical protein [Verrucomicrobiota bacterium]